MQYWLLLALAAGCGPSGHAAGPPEPRRPVSAPGDPYADVDAPAPRPGEPAPRPGEPAPRPGERAPRPGEPAPELGELLVEPPPDPVLAAPRKPARRASPPGDAQAMVDAHNRYRARHCAPPLTWSPRLAQVAQQWASTLRDKGCSFGHSGGTFGENLAAGTAGTLDAEAVVKMWYDEVARYRFPGGGFSAETGHFTQLVWRATSRIGCGRSQCKGLDIWVCEYDPAGNWEGRYRENVLPTSCR